MLTDSQTLKHILGWLRLRPDAVKSHKILSTLICRDNCKLAISRSVSLKSCYSVALNLKHHSVNVFPDQPDSETRTKLV